MIDVTNGTLRGIDQNKAGMGMRSANLPIFT